jgi:predicted DNA-binding transcriptional regulator AlpA
MTDRPINLATDSNATGSGDELLTIAEVAALLRLPVATLRYWRYLGTGPRSFRLGRGVRYWHHDVRAWVEQHYNDDGPKAA